MFHKTIKGWVQTLKNYLYHLPRSVFFNIMYGFPSRKMVLIGVTGTDGKTTTSTLLYHILKSAGINVGVITTIGAKYMGKEINTGLHTTSPDPAQIQKMLKNMHQVGVTHVVCEVTSHALDQFRFWGCKFEVSTITNTSHEHLDYHENMANYINSKAKLFKQSNFSVLNKDDDSYKLIKSQLSEPSSSYSINNKSDFQAKNISFGQKYLSFIVKGQKIVTDSIYDYQIYNILAAFGVITQLNIPVKYLLSTVKRYPETKGRREEVSNNFKFRTIVDFAHTPAALQSTLFSLKRSTKGNLIVIFGATGGRDKSKRPIMGNAVSKLANIAIITADDTRNENIEEINKQIIGGIDPENSEFIAVEQINDIQNINKISQLARTKFVYFNIPNRQDAFNLALKLAQTDDIVVACGKGHETTILHGTTEFPWSETEAFRTAFRFRSMA